MDNLEKIEAVLSHIKNVQKNCYKLGLKLIKIGQFELGRNLIANGQIHDNSKFKGIEFAELFGDSTMLKTVVAHHTAMNAHHPEYWGSIHEMPDVYIAEMVCDCCARAAEFGSDVKDWFVRSATTKYGFKIDDEIGRKIFYYLNLLLEQPFKN